MEEFLQWCHQYGALTIIGVVVLLFFGRMANDTYAGAKNRFPKLFDKATETLQVVQDNSNQQADTATRQEAMISSLAVTIEKKHADHIATHSKLDDLKNAAISYLEGMKKQVRLMADGQNIDAVLADFESAERALRR